MAKRATSAPLRVVGKRIIERRVEPQIPDDIECDEDDRSGTTAIERMSPGEYSTFVLLRDAIPSEIRERFLAGRRLCLIARLPSAEWIRPTSLAFTVVLEQLAEGRDDLDCAVRQCGYDRGYRDKPDFDLSAVVRTLLGNHVIVALLPHETVDASLPAIADLELRLYPTPASLTEAVRRVFSDAPDWPCDIDPQFVRPDDLDLALRRGSSAAHAYELVERLAHATRQKIEEIAARDAAGKQKLADDEVRRSSAKSRTGTTILRPTSPRLDELHGYGAAALWASDLVRDLHDYRAGRLSWTDVDSGCLLSGPPGTGKTMFASALAASAGLPFIATSYADWQSQGDGHLGYVVKCIKQRFDDAAAAAPAILFIDEIDVVGTRGHRGDGDGWWTAVIAAMLEKLDGTTRREGLMVIAACNHPDRIDPALVRSGRLDRRFEIGLPDEDALARIFAHHLPGAPVEAFEKAATVLAGTTSGADVARIAREARRVARREKRDLVAGDLLAIAMPADERPADYRRLMSIHEAGHAIAMFAGGQVPVSLSLVQIGASQGRVQGGASVGLGRIEDIEREVITMLAGRAAEEVVLGHPSAGASLDLEGATTIVKRTIGIAGLGGRLSYSETVDGHDVEARLRDLYGRALRLIGQHRTAVEALADLALERRVLPRRALAEFAIAHGFEVRP